MKYLVTFRNRIFILAILSLVILATVITTLLLFNFDAVEESDTRKIVSLSCQENANKLNSHFRSAEQAMTLVYDYINTSSENYGLGKNMGVVMDRIRVMCNSAANNIEPCSAVFLRLNSELFPDRPGFYIKRSESGFSEFNTADFIKREESDGRIAEFYSSIDDMTPRWTRPYQNLITDTFVISYIMPIVYEGKFVGMAGMDLSLAELNEMINESPTYDKSYAFLTDQTDEPVFEEYINHNNDSEWISSSQTLNNGMFLTVTVPYSIIQESERIVITKVIVITIICVVISMAIALFFVVKIFSSLEQKVYEVQESKNSAIDATNRANQTKMEFLSRMSHDIRTPLNGIIGMIEILRRNRDNDEKVDDCLEKIDMSANHLLSLVNDILDLQKLENGKMSFNTEPFDLNNIIDHCMDITAAQADKDKITVSLNRQNIKHTRLIGSSLRIRQVLLNVLSNAIKYNKTNGSIVFNVEETDSNDEYATFKFMIQDSGIGISPEYVKHVFDRFSQEHDDVRTKYKGTGLGLYITKAIVEEIGGEISVASELNEGSVFTVILPIAIDNAERNAMFDGEAEDIEQADCSGMSVLLVEDNPLNLEIAQQLLEDSGVVVKAVTNGQEAVDEFAGNPKGTYDVILMDIMMPVMDGYQATGTIRSFAREDAATIPILAMTANALEEDVIKCKEAGMNEHIAKPLDMNRVLRLLSQYKKQ